MLSPLWHGLWWKRQRKKRDSASSQSAVESYHRHVRRQPNVITYIQVYLNFFHCDISVFACLFVFWPSVCTVCTAKESSKIEGCTWRWSWAVPLVSELVEPWRQQETCLSLCLPRQRFWQLWPVGAWGAGNCEEVQFFLASTCYHLAMLSENIKYADDTKLYIYVFPDDLARLIC